MRKAQKERDSNRQRGITSQDKIWKVIRNLRETTQHEISTLTGIPLKNVSVYVSALTRAGYLRRVGLRKEGPGPRHKLWRIVKNTGPGAPKLRRCLLDPNLNIITEVTDHVRVD